MLLLMLACGGSTELQKPHDPPAWPMENLVVDQPRPEVPPPAVEPRGAVEPTPEPEPPRDDTDAPSPTEAP